MERKELNSQDGYTVDLLHIAKTLWSKAWILVLSGILAAAIGFSFAAFFITPQYSSAVMLYVNNKSLNQGNSNYSISSSDISASVSLVKTYSVILKNRTTLERVIEQAGVDYSVNEISSMIQATSVDSTQAMRVTVTCDSPYEASDIANCIAEVLPGRITEIIDGVSVAVVDLAVPVLEKVSPSITKYTALGMLLGLVISVGIITVIAITDDTIRTEDDILQNYDFPILAKIPDLLEVNTHSYGKYYQKSAPPRAKR